MNIIGVLFNRSDILQDKQATKIVEELLNGEILSGCG